MMGNGNRKILVTGAAGFIGSALCERLASRGNTVVGIDNLNDYYDVRLKEARLRRMGIEINVTQNASEHKISKSSIKYPNLSFIKSDIRSREKMEILFEEFLPEIVVNLAAQAGVRYSIENPYSYATNNIDGFLVLLECARHWPVKKFIYASSSSVYGGNTKVPFSENDAVDNPVSLYAATKKSNEMMARAYSHLYGIPAIGLRFFTVYGPWGRPDMAPMLFANAILNGKKIKVFNNGLLSRDFTYIDDITEGIVKVVEGDGLPPHDLYNLGHGSPINLLEFISTLEETLGQKAEKEYLPMQKGDVYTTFADTIRMQQDFGYTAPTPLSDGIKKFADWFKEYTGING